VCVYLYTHNKYTLYTHILFKQKLLFWMRFNFLYLYSYIYNTILPKVLDHPLLMKGLTTLVISMSTNLNV